MMRRLMGCAVTALLCLAMLPLLLIVSIDPPDPNDGYRFRNL